MSDTPTAAVDDAAWVRARYEEAKELIEEIRAAHVNHEMTLPADLRESVEDFWAFTFLDGCTTFGRDCGCNRPSTTTPEGS